MYRNDHDAALWRIDVLEAEVRRLEGELARRTAPQEPPSWLAQPIERAPRTTFRSWLTGILVVCALIALPFGRYRHHRTSSCRAQPVSERAASK